MKLQLFKLFHNERCIENLVEKIESKKSELGESNEGRTKAEENLKECNKILRKRGRELTRIEMEVQEQVMCLLVLSMAHHVGILLGIDINIAIISFQEAEIQKKLEPLIKAREEVMYMSSKLEQAQDTLQKAHEADKNHKRTLRDLRKELAAVDKEFQEYQRTVAEESLSQGRNIELEQSQVCVPCLMVSTFQGFSKFLFISFKIVQSRLLLSFLSIYTHSWFSIFRDPFIVNVSLVTNWFF